jgi:periplasmic protein TonB
MSADRIFMNFDDADATDVAPSSLRWGLCFVLIAALHVGVGWIALRWASHAASPTSPPPSAVMIDLAPLPVAPPAPPSEMAPGPRQTISQPPAKPEVQQPLLKAPPSPAPQIAIPLPPRLPPKPPQRLAAHRLPLKRLPDKTPPAPATTAPPQLQAAPAPNAAAPVPGAASVPASNAVPTWQSLLLARLERFKRYPYEALSDHEEGVVYLHFSMNRQGRVLSANIARSSGFDALDQEALALIRRAEPLPPPPPEIAGDSIELTVPVQFFFK